jgi:alkaline phosphatase D
LIPRRQFLQWSAGGLLLGAGCADQEDAVVPPQDDPELPPADGALATAFDPAAIPEDAALFSLGVQAGAMTASSALLWTRVEDGAPCVLRVWRDAGQAGQVLLLRETEVTPADGYVQARVEGLSPGARYRYGFFRRDGGGALAARSALGRFRAAFEEGARRKVLVAASTCTSFGNAPYTSLEMAAAEQPDLFLHLGDMSYNDGAFTVDEFRAKWRQTLTDPGYRAILSACGMYMTWDDHEIIDSSQYDPETMDPELLANGKRAFFETLAVEQGPEGRLWRSYRWGSSVEFFLVDSRSERRPSTRNTPEAIYIGREQMEWLKQALRDSPCHFKVILNSVPMTDLPGLWELAEGDRWEGYRAQRDELLTFLRGAGLRGVYFLSGDFHCGFVARLDPPGGSGDAFWEIAVGPGASGVNPLPLFVDRGTLDREEVFPSNQFVYGSSSRGAMTTLLFDPVQDRVEVRFVEARGEERGKELFRAALLS